MKSYKPLDNLVNTVGNYIQNNSEKIKAGVKYGIIFPTVLVLGLNVLPKFQETINKIIPSSNTNISEAYAAELKQGLYLWGPQIRQFAKANKNMWIMGEEFKKVLPEEEMNEFSEFEKKINKFIDYTGMTHEILIDMDMGKLHAIKIKPSTETEKGFIIYYVENFEDKNSVRVGLGELEIDINQYIEDVLKGAYKYNDLLEQIEANAQAPKISLADKVEETKRDTISKIQEEKRLQEQKTLEGYVSELLNIVNNRFQIVDLENSKRIPVEYNLSGIPEGSLDDKLLEELNLSPDTKLSVKEIIVQNKKVFVYNIIDSDKSNDGNITKYLLPDGRTKTLFDEKNKDDFYTIKVIKSKLGNNKIAPIMSDLILVSSLKKNHNLYRISDGKTTFGFVLAHKKLAIEEVIEKYKEFLKKYKLLNGVILGSASVKRKEKEAEVIEEEVVEEEEVVPEEVVEEEEVVPEEEQEQEEQEEQEEQVEEVPVLIDEGGDDVITTPTPTPTPEQPVLIDEGGDDVSTKYNMEGK